MRLAALFGDNAVLQRGRTVPVWGWAEPGEKITVSVAGKRAGTRAGRDGKWMAKLPALKAGGPFDMTVTGKQTIVVRNVMIGEVWVVSGQSNMEFTVASGKDAEGEVEHASYPKIRMFNAAKIAVVDAPEEARGEWQVCSRQTVGNFSGVGYFFARELHRRLGLAVGIVNSSWGGTIAEAWTSRAALHTSPMFKKMVAAYEKGLPVFEKAVAEYQRKVKEGEDKCYPVDPGNQGHPRGWADPGTSVADWDEMRVPCIWQGAGLNFNGVVWFRKEVEIPAEWEGQDLLLRLAPCDKCDITYFNNVRVGGIGRENPNAWCTPRVYTVPAALVKAGQRNVIAVRIFSYVYAGGFIGSPAEMELSVPKTPDAVPIPLAGVWRYKVEHNFGVITPLAMQQPLGPGNPNSPYSLFNGMIHPLVPYAIRGALWYQGESNVERAYEYRTLFPLMIRSWRRAWKQGDFPFYYVELANYMEQQDMPGEHKWAELREAQAMALRLPNTAVATAIDIGDAMDIHPKNKQEVGRRLALAALRNVYGLKKVVHSGPVFRSAAKEKDRYRLRFDHVDGGLAAHGGKLTGFAVAGTDRKFAWADAKIDGKTVIVSSKAVPAPVAVRYAWADNPACNLYNKAGLPALPFRTDKWPGLTWPKKN